MLCRKNNIDFVTKKAVFRANSSAITHTKTALADKEAFF
jgi:hypothetical protein